MHRACHNHGRVVAIISLLALFACADREPSVFIQANIIGDDECEYQIDGTRALGGVMDTALRSTYWVYPLYRNQVLSTASTAPLMADSSGFLVTGAEVTLLDSDGTRIAFSEPNPYSIESEHTFVPSATETTVGQIVGGLEVIPPQYGQELNDLVGAQGSKTITISVVVRGQYAGNHGVELPEWRWSVRLCQLCLVRFPPEADEPTTTGICDADSSPSTTPCNVGQDQEVDCRLCRNAGDAAVQSFCSGN